MHLLLPLLPKLPLRLPSTALVEPEDWELVDWGLVERSLVL